MTRPLQIVLLVVALGPLALAQQAGFKDFTTATWRIPAEHLPSPPEDACPSVNATVSGNSVAKLPTSAEARKETLQFSIVEIAPAELHIGEEFTATIRLKNLGSAPVLLPWETDGEQVNRVSASGEEESYEVVDIALMLRTGRGKRLPVWLKASAVLFANPGMKSSYLTAAPGQWVDVKLKGKVQCSEDGLPCGKLQADKDASLNAWWYQRQLTHTVQGCNEDHGNHVIRELNSDSRLVVVTGTAPPEQD